MPGGLVGNGQTGMTFPRYDATTIVGLEPAVSIPVLLIVEDEFLVRIVAVQIAEEAGFSVLQAADADEAIRVLQGRSDIRVVLTDIEMPGSMDGLELAQAIRHRWPPIDVVLTSGKMRPAADELPERSHFLPKPYDASELVGLLQDISR
jgi:CheY-like chemotaxis protein